MYKIWTWSPGASFGDPSDDGWDPIDAEDLIAHMEAESHYLGMPVAFRDEFGDEFWKICSLRDDDGDFVGAIVRRIKDGFLFSTTDCETWDLVNMPKRVRV